jgi:hypothetical protein
MKKWILILVILSTIIFLQVEAQIVEIKPGNNRVKFYNYDDATIPQFPGGTIAFFTYLKKNITYKKGSTDEKLMIWFTVKKDGSLGNFKIKKGKNKVNIQEAIRVLTLSPKWKPATIHGKVSEVQYSIPITFTH